jgi:hypothetical protein
MPARCHYFDLLFELMNEWKVMLGVRCAMMKLDVCNMKMLYARERERRKERKKKKEREQYACTFESEKRVLESVCVGDHLTFLHEKLLKSM